MPSITNDDFFKKFILSIKNNEYFTEDFFFEMANKQGAKNYYPANKKNYPKEIDYNSASQKFDFASKNIPDIDYVFKGNGIVMPAGGKTYLTNAYINIRNLRDLGVDWPIQIWHLGEEEIVGNFKDLVKDLNVEFVDAKLLSHFLPQRILNGWELKSYALKWSPFNFNLLLDPDSFSTRDPTFIFKEKEFIKNKTVFFGDPSFLPTGKVSTTSTSFKIWEITGLKSRPGRFEIESGQVFIEKNECWKPIYLTNWMNEYSDFWYKYIYGDKETFNLAWLKLDQKCFISVPQNLEHARLNGYNFHYWNNYIIFQHLTLDRKYYFEHPAELNPDLIRQGKHMEYYNFLKKNWVI